MPEVVKSFFEITESVGTVAFVIIMVLVIRASLPIVVRPDGSAVWYLSASFVVLCASTGLRALYWAYAPDVVRDFLGKGFVNTVFLAGLSTGGLLILKVFLTIIPERYRDNYSLFTAPWYPDTSEWRIRLLLNLLRNRINK